MLKVLKLPIQNSPYRNHYVKGFETTDPKLTI